jgi:membrane protein
MSGSVLFTAALLSLGRYAIGVYLGNRGIASSFGTAGSIIALSLRVYYAAQIFFWVPSSPGSTHRGSVAFNRWRI